MTNPHTEAIELIEKFKANDYDWITQGNLYCVKQHALIACNEIINAILRCDINVSAETKAVEYWEEVIRQIEISID